MNDNPECAPDANRFGGLAGDYPPRLPRKFKLLLPLKSHIEGLLAKRASYDYIRTLLKAANIVVSKNTVYRFCREVIGQPPVRQSASDKRKFSKLCRSCRHRPAQHQRASRRRYRNSVGSVCPACGDAGVTRVGMHLRLLPVQ